MAKQRHNHEVDDSQWSAVIRAPGRRLELGLRESWSYRDLIAIFVWRDFVAVYKQTILGPLWYLIQPLLTALVFTVVFARIAGVSTDGVPPFLFYMAGTIMWRYFSDCLTKTSNTFVANAQIFGKVYFPRLTVPISAVISNLISLAIQLLLFVAVWAYYATQSDSVAPRLVYLVFVPVLILQMAALGMGFGIIVAALTTKYRDLAQLVGFGLQLWMFATPVVYPMSIVPEHWRWLMALNPMAPVIEMFRVAFLGSGIANLSYWLVSIAVTIVVFVIGATLFNRVERSFLDTI